LKELGIVIPYMRLSEYVNQLRRANSAASEFRSQAAIVLPAPPPAASNNPEGSRAEQKPAEQDPWANVRRSEAIRPGFHYRPLYREMRRI
jgi:hypothetical protein